MGQAELRQPSLLEWSVSSVWLLLSRGVQLEMCGATAAANHWGKANLLTGLKVNMNAMVRVTQLEQHGFTTIYQQWRNILAAPRSGNCEETNHEDVAFRSANTKLCTTRFGSSR